MSAPVLTMSKQEFERAVLLRKVLDKRLTQHKAAEILGLSLRQVERLCRRCRTAGPAALASSAILDLRAVQSAPWAASLDSRSLRPLCAAAATAAKADASDWIRCAYQWLD